ncbi:hypothetical protein G1L22_12905 [Tenacibaculum finnmarkense]|uniref:hypothetical protein n=1 Tax=Tenacibaculum finnmarkense TaxID=2781243 RepID=UPI00187B59FD|nr:hypothetical protein [Tenacibaculum finnmarkense]MBE7649184.1 hypothetical protein [Tenacibaculum finnmarkense genomovar ulcerans]MCG8740005.1 hypothetical protein [Tenacibaculum finnmarkense]MCG8781613.1 hypothetical protein [Tenacibaculum finnmarkense]MCG8791296.1 hypothetical protein [Tenacibaculum finnmarkense]MCG8801519.1 hypothetical protein [Tenacibaculum finnmarkense]
MSEKILTEEIVLNSFNKSGYTFPEIQKHLDDGFTVKHIFYSPSGNYKNGIVITVHLAKEKL